jgi:glycosyltransferase involved in cell wall biosynthesis
MGIANDDPLEAQTIDTMTVKNSEDSTRNNRLRAPIRIAIVVSHPIQHFAPLHRKLAQLPGVELKVFFCLNWGANSYFDHEFDTELQWDIPLLDGYAFEFLQGTQHIRKLRFGRVDNPSVGRALADFQPDVVQVFGYASRTMWRAARECNRKKIPVLLFSDSNAKARRPLWKRLVKTVVVGMFYRLVDGALFIGDNNYDYHLRYGVPMERLFQGACPIDAERLTLSAGDPVAARHEIRRRHAIPDDAFVAMFSGKLSARKSPTHLLSAIDRCAGHKGNIWALLVGEGSERSQIEREIEEHKIRNVVLAGFVNQNSIAKYYAASDVLVVPSAYDAHPLVLPEAGCFGLPVIASDRIGCIGKSDTARVRENTLVYAYSDINALTSCLVRLCEDKGLYTAMSNSARRIAATQDISVAAVQVRDAAMTLKQLGRRKLGRRK